MGHGRKVGLMQMEYEFKDQTRMEGKATGI
jgi:hypothetical protein